MNLYKLLTGLILILVIGCSNPLKYDSAILHLNTEYEVSAFGVLAGNTRGSCSASQIKYMGSYYILTAKHCVENTNVEILNYTAKNVLILLKDATIVVNVSKFKISENSDVAILPLIHPILNESLKLADSDVGYDADIHLIGFPLGVKDSILRVGIAKSDRIPWYGSEARLIQISAAPGDSGGSVLNSSNEVVGILVAGDSAGPFLAYMVPVSNIKALIGI